MDSPVASEGRRTRLAEQRKALPDGPGVYLFRDAEGQGHLRRQGASRCSKRVASHFSNPVTRGAYEMVDAIDDVEFVLVATEAEALLAEQNFIKQYRPRFNIRLRDDKSYPFIAISMDEDFPRVYFTRERHRRDRAVLRARTRTPSACAARSTCSGKVFLFRSCQGAEPGRRSRLAVPGLLHQALRGALRRLRHARGVPRVDRRRRRVPVRALPRDRARPRAADEGGRRRRRSTSRRRSSATACAPCARCSSASASPTSRSARSTSSPSRSTAPTPTRRSSRSATACSPTASPSTSRTPAERDVGRGRRGVPRCSTTATQMAIPPQIIVQERASRTATRSPRRSAERRGGQRRGARRRARRQAPDPRARRAQRAAGARPGAAEGRAPPPAARRGARRAAGGARARRAAAAHRVLRHLEPDGHAHGRLDGRLRGRRAEEVRLPALQRSAALEEGVPDDFAAMEEVLGAAPRAVGDASRTSRPHDPKRNESFATLPNLIVIDGGPGQLAGGPARARGLPRARRGGRLAGQAASRRSSCPAAREPIVLAARHARAAAAAARARRGAPLRHHPPPHAPRPRDDGVDPRRPARASARRASARCWRTSARPRRSSPRRASSSRRCPGLPGKTAREIWTHLHRTGD